MDSDSEEENPDWNKFWSYIPHPDDPHGVDECMEDWGTIMNGERNRRRLIAEGKRRSGRD